MLNLLVYFNWLVLFCIAITDAREQRIPNKLLVLLFLIIVAEIFSNGEIFHSVLQSFLGGAVYFSVCLMLFILRAMAPGDVKLMGVVGFWVGYGQALNAAYWIALSAVVVGCFYALLKLAESRERQSLYSNIYLLTSPKTRFYSGGSDLAFQSKLRMPFAPIVVIGLALHQYFNHA